jgi:hypothetical protein
VLIVLPPVVLFRRVPLHPTAREEQILNVFENMLQSQMFGPKRKGVTLPNGTMTYRHHHVLLGWADDVAWDKQDMIVVAGQYQDWC